MAKFFLCKLPHGLQVTHKGETIVLRGANASFNPAAAVIGLNNMEGDVLGFGLTELNDKQAEAFADWASEVTFTRGADGKPAKQKLAEPFAPLQNGSILGPFNSEGDARDEAKTLGSAINTGLEPIDPKTDKGMKDAGLEVAETPKK